MKKLLFLAALTGIVLATAAAQSETPYGRTSDAALPEWARLMYAPDPDPGAVVAAFRTYYAAHPFVKNGHTQYLKRWLRELETYPAQFQAPHLTSEERQALRQAERLYLQQHDAQQQARSGAWTSIGPWDWDHDAAARSYAPGAAHVYTVEQCPTNADVLYAGTATAGLWKSTNHGSSWTNMTLNNMAKEVYAVEIHPIDCEEVYAAMLGSIHKSTDGGLTWQPTGSAAFQGLNLEVFDIRVSTAATEVVWAATSGGLYRSNDRGATWTRPLTGVIQEIEFHPTLPTIIYAVRQTGNRTEFHRSEDGGTTFVRQTVGWPVPASNAENKRAEIAITPAAPDKVYALLTGEANGGSGLYGVYVSEDAGTTWAFACCGPQPAGVPGPNNINMMGWDDAGQDDGGQYYYDLALAVSPTDANHVFVAGVNLWVSTDGGQSFTCPAKWSHPYKANYVHADIHDIQYYPNGDIWLACDGGIFRSTDAGANFQRSMYGIAGSDFWGFGVGFNNDQLMVGGAYHNGTLVKNGNVYDNDWLCTDGGDGVGGAVNPIFENQLYSHYNIKTMTDDRTVAPTTRDYALDPSWTYITGRFSQIEFAHDNYSVHYFGNENGLYKTEDDNRTVSLIHDFGEEVGDVEVAWTNPQVMYVATFPGYWDTKKLYKTTDGGITWTDITPPASVFNDLRYCPYDVEVSYNDENVLWIARLNFQTNDNRKVFRSDDGGMTWTNITTDALNGEVLTNIIAQRGTDDHLYLGTTRTVYHRSGGAWELFADGLPANTRSRQLAISYRSGTLINATDRSVWVADLPEISTTDVQISVDKYFSGCARDTFRFADYSTVPLDATFAWSFPGAAWVSDVQARNPLVLYAQPGSYSATLTVNGQTQTRENIVEVGSDCSPEPLAGRALRLSGQHFITDEPLRMTSDTITMMGWIKPDGVQNDYTGILINDGEAAGLNLRVNNELGYHWPGGSTHWAWSSGLTVPTDEWSFVAMVITPQAMTMYLNDEQRSRTFGTPIAAVDWSRIRIGSYQGWDSRQFMGDMDEFAVWNRALTQAEIREWRHRTKHQLADPNDPAFDAHLVAYFQFNEASGKVYDRVGSNHGNLGNGAVRPASTAPVGAGTSSRQTVSSGGDYAFAEEQLTLTFPDFGIPPSGELVVTHLRATPAALPDRPLHTDHYWIVNHYGPAGFDAPSDIVFAGFTDLLPTQPERYLLHQRPANAGDEPWGAHVAEAAAVDVGAGSIAMGAGNGVNSFGQWMLSQSDVVSTDNPVQVAAAFVYPNPLPAGVGLQVTAQGAGEQQFDLYDTQGRLVRRTWFRDSAYLQLPGLAAGTYTYRIQGPSGTVSGKLVRI